MSNYPLLSRFAIWVALPFVGLCLFVYSHLQSSISPLDTDIVLSGLDNSVKISHDSYGTPSIVATTDNDAFFALGYKHASDRMWQLELQRRIAQGRLSEVFGPDSLQADIWMRTLGLQNAAERSLQYLTPEAKKVLLAYRDGINAWLATTASLPVEFQSLNIQPEPWRIVDSLSWQKVFSLQLNGNMYNELRRYLLRGKFTANQMQYFYPYDPVDTVEKNTQPISIELLARHDTMRSYGIGHPFSGSNAWVVSGQYTASGVPMIANDPHLGLQLPTLWYTAKLRGDRLDVSGMTLVGLPAVVFGQNRDIAWGGTSLESDQQDLFIEHISADNPNQYMTAQGWKHFDIRREEIKVSAGFPAALREPIKPIEIIVRSTVRGPVISDTFSDLDEVLSLRWAALDAKDHTFDSFLKLQYASNWQTFRQAFYRFKSPGLNFVYADRTGNIGYQVVGMMPKRSVGIGILPQPASVNNDWQGYHEFELLPSEFNPEKGFWVSANEKVVHSQDIVISHGWAPSARHDRITTLLQQYIDNKTAISVEQMQRIQLDNKDLTALALLPFLSQLEADGEQQQTAIAVLKAWDGKYAPESVGATLLTTWQHYLVKAIFDKNLKSSWQRPGIAALLESSSELLNGFKLAKVLSTEEHGWCGKGQVTPCQAELKLSLKRALAHLEKLTGSASVSDWRWERVLKTEFVHQPFGEAKGLELLFKKTTHKGASPNSVNTANALFDWSTGFTQNFGAGFRQVFELNNERSHWYMLSTGQSGNVMSPHFADMIVPFANGELAPLVDKSQTSEILSLNALRGDL
ncbi:penicillin acylase family protein [Motilimonas pumila]|nr:penicillin acylase family protein [Motilimonas pumila]